MKVDTKKPVREVEEARGDIDMGSGENAELENSSRKRRKVVKEVVEVVNKERTDHDQMYGGGGRILRSRSAAKSENCSVTDSEENSSNIVVQNSRVTRYGQKMMNLEQESAIVLFTESQKLKKKCGRPPKVEKKEADELFGSPPDTLKRKPGRPRKLKSESSGLENKLKGKRGRPRKVKMESDNTLLDELESLKLSPVKKLKYKRGRPPKSERENSQLFVSVPKMKLKGKRGRPRKAQKESDNPLCGGLKSLKRKRGRPPKAEQSSGVLKNEGKLHLNSRNRVKFDVPIDCLSADKRCIKKEPNIKRTLLAASDLPQEDLQPVPRLTTSSKLITRNDKIKDVKKVVKPKIKEFDCSRSAAKHLLRERITEILLTAGWTIQYRPRCKREYNDAVYVSPEGRTHWSITLAYNVLKMHYEEGDGDSTVYKTGFVFTPIPEEEFMILKRKSRKKKEEMKQQGGNGKLKKFLKKRERGDEMSSFCSSVSKSIKRKIKGNNLLSELENSDDKLEKESPRSFRNPNQRKTQHRNRCALLVRNAEESINSNNDGYLLYNGKRTLLAWMIDLGILSLDEKVKYLNQRRTRVKLEGRITRDGIHCNCCGKVITISEFEMHAGSRLNHAFENMYVESGSTLLQCLLESWTKQNEPRCQGYHFVDVDVDDPNDDTCGICGDGGDLICCDSCPSTFHQSCLDIKKFPSGHWHCLYCSCKSCGQVTADLCQRAAFQEASAAELHTCSLCEEKYHPICVQPADASYNDVNSSMFCGKECQMLHERLQRLLGVRQDLEEGFSWTLVHRSDVGPEVSVCSEVSQRIKCNAKLAVALFVMDECFLPITDHRSGINLIHNIVYNCGSNFSRLNYSGFYTAILEKNDETICAASLRIHGNELAEMPFIGTRYMYRRQGMCSRFLNAIESALTSLNVEKLVIPAISELSDTWTSVFGFKPIGEASRQRMRNMNLLVFPGVEMLQKPLLNDHFPTECLKSSQLAEHQTLKAVASSSEKACSLDSGLNTSIKGTAQGGCEISDEHAVIECNSDQNNRILKATSEFDTNNVTDCTQDVINHNSDGRNNNFENSLGYPCHSCGEGKQVGQYQNTSPGSTISDAVEISLESHNQLTSNGTSAVHDNSCLAICLKESAAGDKSSLYLSNKGTGSVDSLVTTEATDPMQRFAISSHGEHENQLGAISTTHPHKADFIHDGEAVCFGSETANGCQATLQVDRKISTTSQADMLTEPVTSARVCSNCHPCGMLPEADELCITETSNGTHEDNAVHKVTNGVHYNRHSTVVDSIPDSVRTNNFSKQYESGSQNNT